MPGTVLPRANRKADNPAKPIAVLREPLDPAKLAIGAIIVMIMAAIMTNGNVRVLIIVNPPNIELHNIRRCPCEPVTYNYSHIDIDIVTQCQLAISNYQNITIDISAFSWHTAAAGDNFDNTQPRFPYITSMGADNMKTAYILAIAVVAVLIQSAAFAEDLYGESYFTLFAQSTSGSTLASWDYEFPGITAQYDPVSYPWIEPPLTFKLENIHCETLPDPTVQAALFCDVPLEANVGQTLWVTARTNPSDFNAFVDMLTNPIPDKTCVWANIGFADNANDYLVSAGHGLYLSEGLNDEVSRIGLRIDYASTTPSVPEPSSAAALILGLLPFGLLWRKRFT